MPILAYSSSCSASKESSAMNSDTVKPIPPSAATPQTWDDTARRLGSLPQPRRWAISDPGYRCRSPCRRSGRAPLPRRSCWRVASARIVAGDHDAGVGKREQRHDQHGCVGVEPVLEVLDHVAPLDRVGRGHQAEDHAGDRRVHAGRRNAIQTTTPITHSKGRCGSRRSAASARPSGCQPRRPASQTMLMSFE